jgi:AcrR family transcriptional regulator
MLEAMARHVGERGYAEASVQDVVERAGVSSTTFYEHFSDKLDCFLQAYDAVVRRMMPESMTVMTAQGAAAIISSRVAAGQPEQVPEMLPDLLYFIPAPFIGAGEAAKAADRAREEQTATGGNDRRPTTPTAV